MEEKDLQRLLNRSPVFGVLEKKDRGALARAGVQHRVGSGEDLFHEGDDCESIIVLLRGRVRLWRLTRSGHVLVLRCCGPQEILGQMSAIDGSPHSVSASTETAVDLLGIPAARFRALLEGESRAAIRLCTVLARRVRELSDELEAMKWSSIGERVVRLLQAIAVDRREIRITHQALADQVGGTRENVTRVLGLLRDSGVLTLRRGFIEVLDHQKLSRAGLPGGG